VSGSRAGQTGREQPGVSTRRAAARAARGSVARHARLGPPRVRALRLTPPAHALVPGGATGARASVIVVLGFLAMFASSPGQSYWLSLFVDDMIAGTGLSRTGFSIVYAGATVFSAAMVLAVGAAFDRRGAAVTWAAVALGLAAGSLLMSFATGALVALVALGLLRAFGQGLFPLVATLLVARTFSGWRGRALAVSHLGATLAAAALPPLAAGLLAAFGWRTSLQITAAIVLVAVLPLALPVAWASPAAPPARRAPRLRLRRIRPIGGLTARARRFPWREGGGVLLAVLSAAPLISTGAVFHATSLLGASGVSLAGVAAALSVMALGGAAGAVLGGTLVDRAGVRTSLVTMSALLVLGVGLLMIVVPAAALAAFAVLGVAGGVNATGSGTAWARTFGVKRLGELQGVAEAGRIAAAALGPLPLAVALQLTGTYAVGLLALGALAAACAVASARWRPAAG
jgi:MFS family permease